MSTSSFPFPKEWVKSAAVRALKEGGTSLIEDIAKELSEDQLKGLIKTLEKVAKDKKETITVTVKG